MTLELQILIISSIFCIITVIILLIQKKGYLKHKILTIFMLLLSMLFFIASSAFFYSEYSAYQKRKKRYVKTSNNIQKLDEYKFSNLEIDFLEEFNKAKNTLIGYEKFFEESSKNYNPDDFSYENILKEEIISGFENKEYSLEYWNDIQQTVENTYENIVFNHWDEFPIAIIGNSPNEEQIFYKGAENEQIEFYSKLIYIQRKIKSLNRSSKKIKDLWSTNKIFIYTILTKTNYNKISKTINNLITVHDIIVLESNHKEFYTNHNLWTNDGYYNDVFLSFPSKEIVESYKNNWLFSFWDRRFEENNDQTVYKILKELQSHYKD